MIASLYQSAVAAGRRGRDEAGGRGPRGSRVVLEVVLGAQPPADAEDVGGRAVRVELDVVARALPRVASRRRAGRAPGRGRRRRCRAASSGELEPARLGVVRVEVHDARGRRRRRSSECLRVGESTSLSTSWNASRSFVCSAGCSRRAAFTARDQLRRLSGLVEVPVAQLVLLRVEVLLAARAAAAALLDQLERRPVDAVVRATGSPPARAARRTSAGRRSAVLGAGCPACSARSSGGRTRARPAASARSGSPRARRLVLRQVK